MAKDKPVERTPDDDVVTRTRERFLAARNSVNSCRDRSDNMSKFLYESGTSKYVTPNDTVAPNATINMFIVAMEQLNALLSDTPLSITAIPKKPDVDFDSVIYQQVLTWILSRNRWDLMRPILQKNAAIYGTGFIKLLKDPKLGIRLKNLDPRYVVIDPLARGELDDAKYVIELCPYTRGELQRLYPNKEIVIKSDNGIDDEVNAELMAIYNNAEVPSEKNEYINVYEMWTSDGRRTVTTDWQVLSDEKTDWPFAYPFIAFPWYVLPDRIFGRDMITDTENILNTLNRMYQNLDVILAKTANPQKIVSTKSGINVGKLTNEPGLVIPTVLPDARGAMDWAPTVQMPREYFEYIQRLEYYLTMLFGTQDILMGQATINSNVPSGRSLETLNNAAQTRLREVFRNLKNTCTTLGYKLMALIPMVYTEDQMVRITGADIQQIDDAFKREAGRVAKDVANAGALTPEEIQKGVELYQQEKGRNFDGDTKVAYMRFNGTKLANAADFDIDVSGGLDTPKTKVDMIAQIKDLFMNGKVDLETYLDVAEIPMKEKILLRNKDIQEFLAWKQQQQMAAQAPQGAPGMPPGMPGAPTVPGAEGGVPAGIPPEIAAALAAAGGQPPQA